MENTIIHPFPGLRPFEENEEHLFFGRERPISQLMSRLRTSHFLAVIGTSGSGKSSLIKAGLLPSLYRGFMAQAGSSWRVALFRPGDNPIGNLAESLARTGIFLQDIVDDEEEDETRDDLQMKIIETTLRRSNKGLVEIVKEARLPGHENLLIVVDQFEELFRFSKLERSHQGKRQDSTAFVNLLLECSRHTECPIYIILTMRTDFLGNCTEFQGLPEAINNGQYLIPRMTRGEKRAAITGPIAVGRAKITPPLLSRLLNDVGNNPDQLPILQHALMRTWDHRTQHQKNHEPLDLHHYEAIGTMENALSQHAEEAYAELKSQKSRTICEKMFKLLTDRGETGRGIRRPAKVKEICQVANASLKDVIKVINIFRQPGRTFLMPPSEVELHEDSVIDISHESLMRIWGRLIDWVKQEEQYAELYLRLAKAAALHEQGQVGLYRDPELMVALKWWDESSPNKVWADRYDSSYYRAIRFLAASKKQKQREIKEKERAQKTKTRLSVGIAVILLIAAIFSIFLYIEAHNNWKLAQAEQKRAEDKTKEAKRHQKTAEEKAKEAEDERQRANMKAKEATEQRLKAEKSESSAKKAQIKAEKEKRKAIEKELEAKIQGMIVDMNSEEANFRQYLTKAKELAVQSIAETNNIKLKALLALYAYDFNNKAYQDLKDNTQKIFNEFKNLKAHNKPEQAEGVKNLTNRYNELQEKSKLRPPVPGMFDALRNAYIAIQDSQDIIYNNTESWALTVTNNNSIVFNGGDGRLLTGSLKYRDLKLPVLDVTVADEKKEVFLSQASCYAESSSQIFCGTTDGRIVYWNKKQWEKIKQLEDKKEKILAMAVSTNKNCLVYSVNNTIYIHYLGNTTNPDSTIPFEGGNLIRALTVIEDPSNSFLIAADAKGNKGNIFHWDLSKDIKAKKRLNANFESRAFYALAYDASRKWLVLANSSGEILLFPGIDCKSLKSDAEIHSYIFDKMHKGIVRTLAFSPGGRYLASGGYDGTIMLWDLKDLAAQQAYSTAKQEPILTIDSKKRILSLVFTTNQEYMIFSDSQQLRICPTQPEPFYKMLCKLYQDEKWEFKPEEWKLYFGETIKKKELRICR